MTYLPPYRNGVRVVRYYKNMVRIDAKGIGGFDMRQDDFSDDGKLLAAIAKAAIPVRIEDVRSAA